MSIPSRHSSEETAIEAATCCAPDGRLSCCNINRTAVRAEPIAVKTSTCTGNRPVETCCKDIRGKKSRTLVDPDVIRDIVLGFSDGLTVPFGVTAGLSTTGNSHIVVVGGIAELVSGAVSMGIGGYLAAQAERDHFRYMQKQIKHRVQLSCNGELEKEVMNVLAPYGLDQSTCNRITARLLSQEPKDSTFLTTRRPPHIFPRFRGTRPMPTLPDPEKGQQPLISQDTGITAFLLKFAEGEEEVSTRRMFTSALRIGTSYMCSGVIPLLPYFFLSDVLTALYVSIGLTAFVLIVFGVAKAHTSGSGDSLRSYAKSIAGTVALGACAASIAYGVGYGLEHSNAGK